MIVEFLKKVRSFLFQFDFIWSIPLAFMGFVLFPYFGAKIFGNGFTFYSPEFFHASIYAGLVVMMVGSFTQMGIFFQFPEVYSFYLGEGFKDLPVWQKAKIFLLVYFFFYASLLLAWAMIV